MRCVADYARCTFALGALKELGAVAFFPAIFASYLALLFNLFLVLVAVPLLVIVVVVVTIKPVMLRLRVHPVILCTCLHYFVHGARRSWDELHDRFMALMFTPKACRVFLEAFSGAVSASRPFAYLVHLVCIRYCFNSGFVVLLNLLDSALLQPSGGGCRSDVLVPLSCKLPAPCLYDASS